MRGMDYAFSSNKTYSACTHILRRGIYTQYPLYISSITEDRQGGTGEAGEGVEIERWGQRAEWWRYDSEDQWLEQRENSECTEETDLLSVGGCVCS